MAIIIPHQSQVSIQTAGGERPTQYRSVSEFMTPGRENLSKDLQQFAAGLGEVGNMMAHKQRELRDLMLIEDMNKFQLGVQAWNDDYRQRNQGKNQCKTARFMAYPFGLMSLP